LAASGRGIQRVQRHGLDAVERSAHVALHRRHLKVDAAPATTLVAEPQTDPHRLRVGDDLGRVTGQVEVIPGCSQRLVEAIDDLLGTRAERRVVVAGSTRSQLKTQLHCETALQQEDGLAILIANPVKHCGDDHGVQPALQPWRRHTSVSGVVADESL